MEKLTAVALLMSILSMCMSCAALWPHSKEGVTNFRDVVLWSAFVFVLVGFLTVGWRALDAVPRRGTAPSTESRQPYSVSMPSTSLADR